MTKLYEIGPFRLDSEAGVVTRAGVSMPLGSRAVAVLTALVESANEYVSKASIMDAAWPGVIVEESNLAVQISAIRRVLAQAPGGERWVETLPRRGYRFVGPVTELPDKVAQGAGSGVQRSNLPEPLTSFVGRERELVEIKRLLPGKRLLTLVGVGGIGKTRLVLQVAAEVIDAYRDGVWLVEFGSITDPLLVPTKVAQVLGVQERTGTPLTQTLCNHLKLRQQLLLLDNCEHLRDACAAFVDAILRGAAEVKIIATSRESLHVAGEQTYSLPTLSLPEPTSSIESMGRSEAIQLFIERAQRQQPGFGLSAARAATVAQLCIHLDGIPLALELAAARIRSLSVEQINARLGDRFRLLTDRSPNALPRQQTMRATLDWSYDLLAEDERALLRRLAIFAGGFTLEAASAVGSDHAVDDHAVIDLLAQLVARSLVIADTSKAGARYRLLETMRAYAQEKLVEAGEADAVERRHAQYCRDLFQRAVDDWLRLPESSWCDRYLPEVDNVRAALEWSLGVNGDLALAVGLAGASGPMWTTLSLYGEGMQRLEAVSTRIASGSSEADQARLWLWFGSLHESSEPAQACAAYEKAIELFQHLDDAIGLCHARVWLSRVLATFGRFEACAIALADALPALDRSRAPRLLGMHSANSAYLHLMTGDVIRSRQDYERALPYFREAGSEFGVLACTSNLANVCWATGDLDAAESSYREVIAMWRMSGADRKSALGFALSNLSGVLTERDRLDDALMAAREGLPMLSDIGNIWKFMDFLALRAGLAGKVAAAAQLIGYADSAFTRTLTERDPIEVRAHARLHALLRETFAPDELKRLLDEGAKMSVDEACRLALEG